MPRLQNRLLRDLRSIDPLLTLLLRSCRDCNSAINELRWLRDHALHIVKNDVFRASVPGWRTLLRRMAEQRASGMPLQYILGTEMFGDLEIHCRPGVLIPRQETASSITHLVSLLRDTHALPSQLRVLDLCTGTGCIPLHFQHELLQTHRDVIPLRLLGVDISPAAVRLARYNHRCLLEAQQANLLEWEKSTNIMLGQNKRNMFRFQINALENTEFRQANVLGSISNDVDARVEQAPSITRVLHSAGMPPAWDILISNPPYISPKSFLHTTSRSVRNFEPKLALVPPSGISGGDTEQGDAFYPRLITISSQIKAQIALFEVADLEQAVRVARMARNSNQFHVVEIWRDQPALKSNTTGHEVIDGFCVLGQGNGRSVVCWTDTGAIWLGRRI